MLFRYRAIPMDGGDGAEMARGEHVAGSAAEVRAALRRVGLQVIDLRVVSRRTASPRSSTDEGSFGASLRDGIRDWNHRRARTRRRAIRTELYDGLATMLRSGIPILEAVETLASVTRGRRSGRRRMLLEVREVLHGGGTLAEAMSDQPAWFDPIEIAMVRTGQHGGHLPDVLEALSRRHARSDELGHKLASALTYPCVVGIVGLGVVVFLSTQTLPNLTSVLTDAEIEIPLLTRRVMGAGQFLAKQWPWLLLLVIVAPLAVVFAQTAWRRAGWRVPGWLRGWRPATLRRVAVSRVVGQFAELVRAGVPAVEALHVLAPTAPGGLRGELRAVATRVENGEDLANAFENDHWFDAEFRRLVAVGEASGELPDTLDRLAERYTRQATRLIDRLATLLEPAVILLLAALIGLVVLAAILPMLRLQEILR